MANKQSLGKLKSLIDDFTNVKGGMLYRNSFALACLLAQQGESRASHKIINCLFDVLGWENRKTYFLDLIESIDKYAGEYAKEIEANEEINSLFERRA